MLATHYADVGLPELTTAGVGWFEIGLAGAIAMRPVPALLMLAAAWKLSSESLWIVSGAPIWEVVERASDPFLRPNDWRHSNPASPAARHVCAHVASPRHETGSMMRVIPLRSYGSRESRRRRSLCIPVSNVES